MKKVYVSTDSILVAQLRAMLETNHIDCMVRNDFLTGAAGELPVMECWPELWVIEDFQVDKAQTLINTLVHAHPGGSSWICPNCAESLEAAFSQCWHCGHERVGGAD